MIEGPIQTNNSGLVFYFDTKEPKSYVGEPTTNRNQQISNYTGTNYADGTHGGEWTSDPTRFTKTYNASIITPIGLGATLCSESGTAGYHHLSSMGGGGESGAHSISCYVKPLNSITDFTIGMLNDGGNQVSFNLSTKAITYGGGISNRNAFCVEVSGFPGWLYVGANIEGRAGGWVGCVGISTSSSYTPTAPYKAFYITGLQYEYKVAPTKFTVGTRSNTQGLLDLTGNYTIDLTNAAYDSSSKIYLSGSKAIKINSNNSLFSNAFTWSAWHYIIADGGTGYAGIFWAEGAVAGGSGYQYILSYRNLGSNAYAHYRINNATTGWGNTDTGTLMSSMLNKWIYTTWTFNNGTTKIYINGVLSHTDTSRGAYNGGSDSPIYIGARNDLWGSINGYIDLVSYHNRALTDAEILRNFNSQRSRYSV
jgi:hypothetical protein